MGNVVVEKRLGIKPLVFKKKVASYSRVSTSKDTSLSSLGGQINHFTNLIVSHPDWLYVGAYVDEGISGTKGNRPEFQRMIDDALNKKIDLILTKSISRFARNTTLLLETIRLLNAHNVDVYFEEQRIHTLSSEGELLLTIASSVAEGEIKSMSENMRWKVKKFFEKGELITDFDEAIFNFNLEKAIVHKDKSITFKFYSGFETTLKPEE